MAGKGVPKESNWQGRDKNTTGEYEGKHSRSRCRLSRPFHCDGLFSCRVVGVRHCPHTASSSTII